MTPQAILDFIHNEVRPASLNVLRIAPDGSRRPTPARWKRWQAEPQPDEVIESWFGAGNATGVAIVTGYGDVEALDFDDADTFTAFVDTAEAIGLDVVAIIAAGWSEHSPSGGGHLIYRCSGVEGNQPLAKRPEPGHPRRGKALIETRGVGGLLVVAPSYGSTHLSGNPYVNDSGGPLTMATITPAERQSVFELARAFDEMPERDFDAPKPSTPRIGDDLRPGDVYDASFTRLSWKHTLENAGFSFVCSHGEIDYYRRPGKTDGISASVNWDGRCRLRIFTTSTALEPGMYSPFAFYTCWEHNGDWRAAGKALYADGFGRKPEPRVVTGEPSPNDDEAGESGEASSDEPVVRQLAPGIGVFRGAFVAIRQSDDGVQTTPLANFTARIVKVVTRDDGAEITRHYAIEVTHQNGRRVTVETPAGSFAALAWIAEAGADFILSAGSTVKDKVRQAIQLLSQEEGVANEQTFAYTGWKTIGGEHVYLVGNGGIGPNGLDITISTDLPGRLELVSLPEPAAGASLRDDALAQIDLLSVAPLAISAPLFALTMASILNPMHSVDFLVHIYGQTGTFKTELAALVQRHVGAQFTARRLPENWHSTANAIETMAFAAKDIPIVIDDFMPEGGASDQARIRGAFQRIARAAGNGAGRSRLNADASMQVQRYPRGLLTSTGEDVPGGHSATGRTLLIEVAPGDVDTEQLALLQGAGEGGAFARVTASVIHFVAANWECTQAQYTNLIAEHVATLRARPAAHSRHPDTLATLLAAANVWIDTLLTLEAITQSERDDALQRVRDGILASGEAQASEVREVDPCDQFIRLISAALVSEHAHLVDPDTNGEPRHSTSFGWRPRFVAVNGDTVPDFQPRGERIGWVNERGVFLNPDAALAAAQALGKSQGISIPWQSKTLGKRLQESGKLLSTEPGRSTQKVRVEATQQRAWHFATDTFVELATPTHADGDNVRHFGEKRGVA